MSVPAYESYIDSGDEWLKRIPRHWGVTALKRAVDPERSITYGIVQGGAHVPEGVPYIRPMDMSDEAGVFDVNSLLRTAPEIANTYGRSALKAGDLICSIGPSFGKVMVVPDGLAGANLTQGTARVAVARDYHARYIFWALRSQPSYSQWECSVGGATFRALNLAPLAETRVCKPPLSEQVHIAAFLDWEVGKIDALVEAQLRLIELLKEKRQAVIARAVTKGIDPTAPMKDSGVEWLGNVPAHWLLTPIRKAARLESGHTPSRSRPEWWQDCSIPWFSLADVWQIREAKRDYVYETSEMVSELGLANSSARLLPVNTVMLSRTASVGFSAIMGVPMATTQDFANWVCGTRLNPEFLLQVLRGMPGEFRRLMMGSTHNTIYMPDIKSLAMALPPLEEQKKIVDHLKLLTGRYDELTREAEAAVDLLRERRSALISAAVTGKIDVRGVVPNRAEAA